MRWIADDGPAQLIWPQGSWLAFVVNLIFAIAGILVLFAVLTALFERKRNGHWFFQRCSSCRRRRRNKRAGRGKP